MVASSVSRHCPVPVEMVAVNDVFGESGTPAQLLEKYGLSAQAIVEAVERVQPRVHRGSVSV
jgi:transketolase